MFTDSLISCLDLKSAPPEFGGHKPESMFWVPPDGQLCLQHVLLEKDISYAPHTHSEYTIVLCLNGAITKTQLGQTQVVEPGEVMMGNFGIEHASSYLSNGGQCEAVCLTFNRSLLANLAAEFLLPIPRHDDGPVFLGKLSNPVIWDCAKNVVREMQGQQHGHKIVIEALASRMLVETLRAWPRHQLENCKVDMKPRLPRRDFVRAHEFMRWCRKDEFRLQHLCSFIGSSEERFTRLFQAATNDTPAIFYNRMLLERGRSLLLDDCLSIKEISYQLGFKTSSHFIVAFRRQFGFTPQDYRLRHLEF